MNKIIGLVLVIAMLLVPAVSAEMSASEAKESWLETKEHSLDMKEQHREAKLAFAADKSEENRRAVVDTGKAALHAALEEAEAWLVWKKLEARENPEVPDHIQDAIEQDVEANLEKIDELRVDVDNIENQLELGLVWLKMVGKYFELVADVARNSGMLWVHIANEKADTIEDYADQLQETAEEADDQDALEEVEEALDELEVARRNINNAEDVYDKVRIPGTPLIKFAEGNNYLRAARSNLFAAHRHLDLAYRELVR